MWALAARIAPIFGKSSNRWHLTFNASASRECKRQELPTEGGPDCFLWRPGRGYFSSRNRWVRLSLVAWRQEPLRPFQIPFAMIPYSLLIVLWLSAKLLYDTIMNWPAKVKAFNPLDVISSS